MWTPGAALRGFSRRAPPLLPLLYVRVIVPPFHLCSILLLPKFPPCDLDYRSLVYPNAWHNWGCLFFIFCSVRGLSSALCRFPLSTLNYLSAHSHSLTRLSLVLLFDILDQASVRYMLHRLHHRLSILSSHHPPLSF